MRERSVSEISGRLMMKDEGTIGQHLNSSPFRLIRIVLGTPVLLATP
jgi:hypothetical protein